MLFSAQLDLMLKFELSMAINLQHESSKCNLQEALSKMQYLKYYLQIAICKNAPAKWNLQKAIYKRQLSK